MQDESRKHERRQQFRRSDAHHTFERRSMACRDTRNERRCCCHTSRMLEQLETARCERKPSTNALEQRHAQLVLERGDLPAQSRLGDAEGARSR